MTAARPTIGRGLLAVGLVAGFLVSGCSSDVAAAPSLQEIRNVLARHGAAVRHHDRAAFSADLDGDEKAAAFRRRQLAAFGNLVQLPFSLWTYRLEGRTDDRSAERVASRRYGSAAVIVRVALRYAINAADPIPTSHELSWTFVRRHGRIVIAADDGLASAGGASWLGPWDFGPIRVLAAPHSLVLGHPQNASALRGIQATVEAAVPAVSAVWGDGWSRYVVVIVPSSAAEFFAQTGETAQATTQVAALAVSDGADPVTGVVYGQRLIVNPAALTRLSDIGRQITIRHEITHIAAARATTAATPQWLVEGFAEYVANRGSGQSVRTAARELGADVQRGKLPATLPTPDMFATDGESAQAYQGAWLACRLIATRAGTAGLVHLYRLVGGSPLDSDAAVANALRRVLHETTAEFTGQWRSYVSTELG